LLTPSTNQMTSEGFFHVADDNCPWFDERTTVTASTTIVGVSLWLKNQEVGAKPTLRPWLMPSANQKASRVLFLVADQNCPWFDERQKPWTTIVGASLWFNDQEVGTKTTQRPSLTPSMNQMTSEGFFHVADGNCPWFDERAIGTASTTVAGASTWSKN
jgi:hypothetical protein